MMDFSPLPCAAPSSDGHRQFQIRRRLGGGGQGEVYEAWDAQLCRSVALKRLAAPSRRLQQVLTEARLAARLGHPAFVKVFAIDADDAQPAIVMELVPGCTLREYLRAGTPALSTALEMLIAVAEAMCEAHAAQLVHGDLKPSNLMVEPSGRVRILDFGLAKEVDPLATQSGASDLFQGTLVYMAPELLLGQPAGPRGDIYALGVMLYEMVAGTLPHAGLNGVALAAAAIQTSSANWPLPPHCAPALADLVRALTASEPARRAPTMRHAHERLLAVRAALAPGARAAPPAPPLTRWGRRAATGLLCGAAALGLAASSQRQWAAPTYSEAVALRTGMNALLASARGGDPDGAVAQFDAMLRHAPRHAGAAAGLSLAYSMRYAGDQRDEVWLRRADASAQLALARDDQLALAYAAQAWVRESQGRLDEARTLVRQALRLEPGNQFAWRVQAHLLISLRQADAAEAAIEQGARRFPADPWFSDCLGKLRYSQGRYAEAEQAFRRSLRAQPDSTVAHANLAQALLSQGRGADALQVLQLGLQVRPDSRLYSTLGTVLFERADYAGAERAFAHAVSSDKGSPGLYLHWANLADARRWLPDQLAASRQAYRRATELLAPLLAREPGDPTLQSRMGLYLAKLGRRDAAALVARSVSGDPGSAQLQFRAAVAYELIGDRAAALAALARARDLGFPANLVDTEPDLLSLRRDARFHHPHPESKP